jgi:selenocysteine-specific elongation factor
VPKADEAQRIASDRTPIRPDRGHKIFQLLVNSGEILKITDEFYFSKVAIDELITKLRALADVSPDRSFDMTKFKDVAGVSRKYAIPLLEYLDREKITRRAGDKRVIV